jgi:hypothetical protein
MKVAAREELCFLLDCTSLRVLGIFYYCLILENVEDSGFCPPSLPNEATQARLSVKLWGNKVLAGFQGL